MCRNDLLDVFFGDGEGCPGYPIRIIISHLTIELFLITTIFSLLVTAALMLLPQQTTEKYRALATIEWYNISDILLHALKDGSFLLEKSSSCTRHCCGKSTNLLLLKGDRVCIT